MVPTMGHFQYPPHLSGGDGKGHGFGQRPNVIWLLTDQHRHHAMGYAGDPNLHTPAIDDLCHLGLRCGRGTVSGYPLCCPFRGSLLTSRWPHHCIPVHEAPMPEGMPTVANPFKDAGYHTAWFGKWHVDGCKEKDGLAAFWIVPPHRRGGFDEWVGYENNNSQWNTWVHGGEGPGAFLERLDGWETDCLTDRFVAYLERRATAGTPFFAALSVQPPHWPCQAPPEFRRLRADQIRLRPNVPPGSAAEARAREAGPGYYGMIENWDRNVARISATLRRLGMYENTHILLFADHGEMLGSQGMFGKVGPYEESIRTPFLFAGGGQYDRCRRGLTDALINHVDIAPTSLGLAGIPVPPWMAGHDWSHVRTGAQPTRQDPDSAFIQSMEYREESPPYRAVVTRDGWKYTCTPQAPWLLYNLNDDPFEMANRIHTKVAAERERRAALHQRLARWIIETGDTFTLPPQP